LFKNNWLCWIKEKKERAGYAAPDTRIWTPKFVMPVMLDATLSVMTAATDCPGVSTVPSLFQFMVIGPLAFTGLQLLVVMLSVNESPLPVFLTYTVLVMLLPGEVEPQSIVDKAVWHALSEYTPMFADVVIDPDEVKVVLTETAPYVVNVRTNPTMVKAITDAIDNFLFAIYVPTHTLVCIES
jgi:hypothetical protein